LGWGCSVRCGRAGGKRNQEFFRYHPTLFGETARQLYAMIATFYNAAAACVDTQYAELSVSSRESRSAWARLIAKVYEADPLLCRRRGSPMRIVAVITEPQQVRKIPSPES
jgi:hypothetical protein